MEITEEDGGLGAGDNEDDEHEEQETKHVVHLMGPVTIVTYTCKVLCK